MKRRRLLKVMATAMGGIAAAAYPVFIERSIVLTNRYRVPVPNLPRAFEGFTLVHLTDLHYGPLVSFDFLASVIERANRIPRDATVVTGDIVHARNSSRRIDEIWPLLGRLQAPQGVFSVLGNHDHWADGDRSRYWLRRTGQDLYTRTHALRRDGETLWLAGAGDLWEHPTRLDTLLGEIPERDCRVVLAHNPDTADTAFNSRVDLMISGHTHGGQIRIPFYGAPVLPVRNKTYSDGVKQTPKGFPIFISRGIGWAIYPVRFNCYPEIAVLELVGGGPVG